MTREQLISVAEELEAAAAYSFAQAKKLRRQATIAEKRERVAAQAKKLRRARVAS